MTTIYFTIPKVPGSVNHLYGQARNGRRYIRQEGRDFKQLVKNILTKIDIPENIYQGRLCLVFHIYFGNKRKRDLDNCMKILQDSLQYVLFEDDSQIDDYRVIRGYDKENPRVEVEVSNI